MRVSEIRVNQIRVNQELGVLKCLMGSLKHAPGANLLVLLFETLIHEIVPFHVKKYYIILQEKQNKKNPLYFFIILILYVLSNQGTHKRIL